MYIPCSNDYAGALTITKNIQHFIQQFLCKCTIRMCKNTMICSHHGTNGQIFVRRSHLCQNLICYPFTIRELNFQFSRTYSISITFLIYPLKIPLPASDVTDFTRSVIVSLMSTPFIS